jgi:ABC-2 type transport system permease protein
MFGLQHLGASFAPAYELPWSLLVWPFQSLVAPARASSVASFGPLILIALLVVALEVALVFRADPAWDRVGIAVPRDKRSAWTRARKKNATSGSVSFTNLVSSLLTRPAGALAWKNLISSPRTQAVGSQLMIVVGIPVLLGLTLVPQLRGMTPVVLGMTGAWGALLLFAGPQFVRNDLRMDLPRLRLLRTYPLTSLEICIAEVGASVSLLTLLQLVLVILSTLVLLPNPIIPFGTGRLIAFALALALLLPGMNAVNVSAQNIFALLFPRWMTLGTKRLSRTANPGQFYLSFLISTGLFALSMIVPVLGALAVGYYLQPFGISTSVVAAAFVAGAFALGEAALVMRLMAGLLDRVDPSSVSESSS